jgi:NADPH:quinone reductase-like Zn-dependent oxidoreductase
MEAYRIDRFGSVDGIVLRSSEDPRPRLKEILMRVRASSLNYHDLTDIAPELGAHNDEILAELG